MADTKPVAGSASVEPHKGTDMVQFGERTLKCQGFHEAFLQCQDAHLPWQTRTTARA